MAFGIPAGYFIMVGITLAIGAIGMLLAKKTQTDSTAPATSKLEFTAADEGIPTVELLGTSKLVGNIIGYWNNRSVAVTQDSSAGGKGGAPAATSNITGYKYYLTWAIGICLGPVDALYTIVQDNDSVVWRGEITRPNDGSSSTITLTKDEETIGSAEIFWGSSVQIPSTVIQTYEGTDIPAYRGLCYIVFNDCYIGDYNRAPNYSFSVRKCPVVGLPFDDTYRQIGEFDVNPATAIWYILTTMRGLSATWLDSVAFNTAALTLYNEKFGIGMRISEVKKATDYIEDILNTIDGVLKYGADGKIGLYLIRGATAVALLPVYTDDMMIEPPTFQRKSWMDTYNMMKVDYSGRNVVVITSLATGGGQIYPLGKIFVPLGEVPYFRFKADSGKFLSQIKQDGIVIWSGHIGGEVADNTYWEDGLFKDIVLEAIFS
ncbi:MAG: hypothetical protein ABFC98_05860 [Candidatus Cloacimonas sp.]